MSHRAPPLPPPPRRVLRALGNVFALFGLLALGMALFGAVLFVLIWLVLRQIPTT